MNKPLKITLLTLAVVVGIPFLVFCGYTFLFADFFSGPSEKECVKTAEEFLGYKLGKKYEILDYDADFSHPDRMLNFSVKVPSDKFKEVVEYCEKELAGRSDITSRTEEDGYTYIESFFQDEWGFQKSLQVLSGEDRVHYQALHVILNEELITFDGMNY